MLKSVLRFMAIRKSPSLPTIYTTKSQFADHWYSAFVGFVAFMLLTLSGCGTGG